MRTIKTNLYDSRGRRIKDLLWEARVYRDNDGKELKHFINTINRLLYVRKTFAPRERHARGGSINRNQLCIVKGRIGNRVKDHLKFLTFYMPQANKETVKDKPELFGAKEDGKDFLEIYKLSMADRHFKFIISPENQNVDIEALTRTLVKRLEKTLGQKLYWTAAIHTDTAHKHAHLLINGIDRNDDEVYIDKSIIKVTMREMARVICTEQVGKRTNEEIRLSQEHALTARRYTRHDDAIADIEKEDNAGDGRFASHIITDNQKLYERLLFLAELGFAAQDKENKRKFYLEKDWKDKLRAIGRYNSFLDARNSLIHSSGKDLKLYTKDSGTIQGKVIKLYVMNDEDSWTNAVLVENERTKQAWYVPMFKPPEDNLLGKTVKFNIKQDKRGYWNPTYETNIKN